MVTYTLYKCPTGDERHHVIKISLLLFLVAGLLLHHVFSDMAESAVVSTLNWDRDKIFTTTKIACTWEKLASELITSCYSVSNA